MQNTDKAKRVSIGEIPEVQELLDLEQEINALKAEHSDVFVQYQDLIDRYNTKLEEADKKVRSEGVTCGPFENYSVGVKFIANKMFEELGEELFLKAGGIMETRTIYDVDPAKVVAAIANKTIPEECVDQFREVRRNYHAPKKRSV